MKKLIAIVFTMTFCNMALAENFGFGVSANESSTTVIFPFNMNEDLRIEPFFAFNDIEDGDAAYNIGAGVFLIKPQSENVDLYFGGRAGFAKDGTFGDGITLSANLGAEYYFIENFSLSGEAGFGIGLQDRNNFGTETQVIIRYYF